MSEVPAQLNILDWVELARSLYANAGWIGLAIALVVIALNAFRADMVQRFAPAWLKWDALPWWVKRALPVATAFGTTAATALAAGVSLKLAALGALPVALSAAGYHVLAQWFANTKPVKTVIEGSSPRVQAAMRLASVRVKLDPSRIP